MPDTNPAIEIIPPSRAGWFMMLRPLRANKIKAVKKGKAFNGKLTVTCGVLWTGDFADKEISIPNEQMRRLIDQVRLALFRHGLEFVNMRHMGNKPAPGIKRERSMQAVFEVEVS